MTKQLQREIARRRTFGIISHPDAGKTTLTEKLLLFGGAIQMAGAVKSRKTARHATSDWMSIERERGISVTSAVLQFDYKGHAVNLLDTPGHQDFSEDTYRVLTAVDSAIMVIDCVKGVESQTRKLMEVCRMRNTPILTFINKLDRQGRDPLELMAEIEDLLQIECAPLSWPIGMGTDFKGIYHLHKKQVTLFSPGGGCKAEESVTFDDLSDPRLDAMLGAQAEDLRTEVDLLQGAGNPFDIEAFLKGSQTPVFFGSAVNNFGVQELLDSFVQIAPAPQPRQAQSRIVSPDEQDFSGFVFKVQANMDPAHRDRIAFVRICSGRFERGMKVRHHRTEKELAVANPIMFLAQERISVEEAWPGDIIGIRNHGTIRIGDTFSEKEPLSFVGIPNFAPEHFRKIQLKTPLKAKQLRKGLQQLVEEGAAQLFQPVENNDLILGAVGVLQFDVIVERLKAEYNVDAVYLPTSFTMARWVRCADPVRLKAFERQQAAKLAKDAQGYLVFLAAGVWQLQYAQEQWPEMEFHSSRECQ